jgi:hypothetical protein
MVLGLLLLTLAQGACPSDADRLTARAFERAAALDLRAAVEQLEQPALQSCQAVRVAAVYLRGLQAARDAYRTGGDAPSLEPVRQAIAFLETQEVGADGRRVEVMKTVLMAAAAASQSERGDMVLLLDHAMDLEKRLVRAAQPPASGVSAHEAAGDLWLQVHRFDSALLAYTAAEQVVGRTPRSTLGLARASRRLDKTQAACDIYRSFVELVSAQTMTAELSEGRAFIAASCSPASRP